MIVQIETDNFVSPAAAAEALDRVGKALAAGGDVDDALAAFDAAAGADVAATTALPETEPAPWADGEARAALCRDLVQAVQPNAILLLNVARGDAAAWIATIFSGPILANEAETRLFLQARQRLSKWYNISVFNEAPDALLPMVLPMVEGPGLVWLDATCEDPSSIADTIRLIIDHAPQAIVVLDKLSPQPRINDVGYRLDQSGYAPCLLASFEHSDIRLFVPDLSAGTAAGWRDTICVAAAGPGGLASLAGLSTLRPVDWMTWGIDGLRAEVEALRRHIGMEERSKWLAHQPLSGGGRVA